MPGPMERVRVWGRCVPGSRTWTTGEASIDLTAVGTGNGCSFHPSGIRSGRMRLFAVRNTRTGCSSWIFSLGEYSASRPEDSSRNGRDAICHLLRVGRECDIREAGDQVEMFCGESPAIAEGSLTTGNGRGSKPRTPPAAAHTSYAR